MKTKYYFNGQQIVVTGGAGGIGFEIVTQFLKSGATVEVWDYSTKAMASAAELLREFEGRVKFTEVNVSEMSSCTKAAAKLSREIDVLVNNAGITRDKSFKKMSSEEWDQVIGTNLTGVFNVTKSIFDKFNSKSANKRIINISSIVAIFGNFGQSNYVACKAGVIGLTKTWAREFAKLGITVNAIAPGFIETAMTKQMPEEVIQSMAEKVPLKRMGQSLDIANACLFLASSDASYVNGVVLGVDGGLVV